ncbi:MAG: aspartate aminotransferase family protein [Anaerolineae bacterium]|nr:aspartate aminotransferase family protein [Anaerolineae bacterium]
MDHIFACHDIIKTDFVHAEDCYQVDAAGRRYVDFESGIWCTALGHRHPRVQRAMQAQMDQVVHLGTRYPNARVEEAARAVLDVTGVTDGKCVFLSSGSEAVEFGAQMARRFSGRNRLLTFQSSYLSALGSTGAKRPDEWVLLDWADCTDDDGWACLDSIPFETLGGFVFEPGGSGSGFVQFPPKALVEALARRVQAAGGLLVVNEITTGMGRTGKWFGFQHYDVQPDIVCLGKGLGNGYPVSAVALRQTVAETIERSGFRYAQSHQNDPLGCAVAVEVIAVMREEGWVEQGTATGAYFLEGLRRLAEKHAVIKAARGRGMLLGLAFHPHERVSAQWAYTALLQRGYLTGYYPAGNLLRFDPALTMPRAEVDGLLACLDELLAEAAA